VSQRHDSVVEANNVNNAIVRVGSGSKLHVNGAEVGVRCTVYNVETAKEAEGPKSVGPERLGSGGIDSQSDGWAVGGRAAIIAIE
jgi:hypothetical protein